MISPSMLAAAATAAATRDAETTATDDANVIRSFILCSKLTLIVAANCCLLVAACRF